ncbi:hypothetical protein RI129_000591 [Pyrocoelia pectoralis]|uniref:G-protein coupled receptors family 1 profile domain-containing protein n=1 Tax=Pyrocoelia pectoralis TaxID=417401 RepID=A0AAN7ZR09_9COLE
MEETTLIETLTSNYSKLELSNSSDFITKLYGPKRDSLCVVIPITIIYVIIFITGLIGNISTCVVISRNKSMHTATNYYLFSLAISDLLLLVSGLPQEMYWIWSRYPYVFGQVFCVLRGLFSETSANATVLTITAFTVERYIAICHPFLSHTMSKLSRAVKFILAIWLVAIIFAVPQALQFEVISIEGIPESTKCDVVRTIIPHSFEFSTFVFFELHLPTNVIFEFTVAVVVAFFLCWAPFHTQRLVAIYGTIPADHEDRQLFFKIYEIITYTSGVLYYFSTTVNPLLYNIMSNKFREAFKETFTQCCRFGFMPPKHPKCSYAVLSRPLKRGQDSYTDSSGKDEASNQTNITSSFRNTTDSINFGRNGVSSSFELAYSAGKPTTILELNSPIFGTKFEHVGKFKDSFSTFTTGHHLPSFSPIGKISELEKTGIVSHISTSSCDISNSSLKDVDNMLLEFELSAYLGIATLDK